MGVKLWGRVTALQKSDYNVYGWVSEYMWVWDRCVTLPWLINVIADEVSKEMKEKLVLFEWKCTQIISNGSWTHLCFLITENKMDLQKLVNEFHNICYKEKPKAKVSRSKVMVILKGKICSDVLDFEQSYRVRTDYQKQCWMNKLCKKRRSLNILVKSCAVSGGGNWQQAWQRSGRISLLTLQDTILVTLLTYRQHMDKKHRRSTVQTEINY